MAHVPVPCGCVVDVDHTMGERLAVCAGGGRSNQFDPEEQTVVVVTCRGGREYVIAAARVAAVTYTAVARHVAGVPEAAV